MTIELMSIKITSYVFILYIIIKMKRSVLKRNWKNLISPISVGYHWRNYLLPSSLSRGHHHRAAIDRYPDHFNSSLFSLINEIDLEMWCCENRYFLISISVGSQFIFGNYWTWVMRGWKALGRFDKRFPVDRETASGLWKLCFFC